LTPNVLGLYRKHNFSKLPKYFETRRPTCLSLEDR
jgi:hypothetical protein